MQPHTVLIVDDDPDFRRVLSEVLQDEGYTVVDAGTVIATHLSHIIQSHAHELLGHEEVSQLLANVAKSAPKLVEDLVPKVLPMAVVVRVLQSLLCERVPLRNMRAIVETLAEQAPRSQDPVVLQALGARVDREIPVASHEREKPQREVVRVVELVGIERAAVRDA